MVLFIDSTKFIDLNPKRPNSINTIDSCNKYSVGCYVKSQRALVVCKFCRDTSRCDVVKKVANHYMLEIGFIKLPH